MNKEFEQWLEEQQYHRVNSDFRTFMSFKVTKDGLWDWKSIAFMSFGIHKIEHELEF